MRSTEKAGRGEAAAGDRATVARSSVRAGDPDDDAAGVGLVERPEGLHDHRVAELGGGRLDVAAGHDRCGPR